MAPHHHMCKGSLRVVRPDFGKTWSAAHHRRSTARPGSGRVTSRRVAAGAGPPAGRSDRARANRVNGPTAGGPGSFCRLVGPARPWRRSPNGTTGAERGARSAAIEPIGEQFRAREPPPVGQPLHRCRSSSLSCMLATRRRRRRRRPPRPGGSRSARCHLRPGDRAARRLPAADHLLAQGQARRRELRRSAAAAFPSTRSLGIVRACSVGGRSEHKEGRAFDWGVSAHGRRTAPRSPASLHWLLKTDKYGNHYAMARRLGIQYVIWNHKIWGAYSASPAGGSTPAPTRTPTTCTSRSPGPAPAGKTSFWTGKVGNVGPPTPRRPRRPAAHPATPRRRRRHHAPRPEPVPAPTLPAGSDARRRDRDRWPAPRPVPRPSAR